MKHAVISILSVLALAAVPAVSVSAADAAEVYVTIADNTGALALAAQPLTVTDADGDGALTVNDALYLAHEAHYEGGAAAGYGNSRTEYGLGITKLWGAEQGSSYGYCVNHASALSLEDPIAEGDHVNAYCYTDLTGFSDTYCFFDVNTVSAKTGEEITLTLSANGYDANWNPVVLPVEGAVITVDGEATAWKTDADGKVTLTLETAGSSVISAVSDTQILVPAVCKAEVTAAETTAPETTAEPETTASATTAAATTTAASTTAATKPAAGTPAATGDKTGFALGAAALTALAGLLLTGKRHDK